MLRQMRILICSYAAPLPPTTDGFRLQITALWELLRERHDVRVLAFRWPDQDGAAADDDSMTLLEPPPEQRGLPRLVSHVRSLAARRPLQARALTQSLRGPLAAELERFRPEVVHVTAESLAPLGADLDGEPSILAALDAQHLNQRARMLAASGLRRQVRRLDIANVARFEATEYERFRRVVLVSPEDAQAVERLNPRLRTAVIPNGVDVDRYRALPGSVRDPNLVLFTGHFGYAPNVLAAEFLAREIMPLVRNAAPEARLALVGRQPPGRIHDLAGAGIEVVGEVPEITPWLSRAGLYVCPMRSGTGIKNKLLEAMANGLACIATPLALRGIAATPGTHVEVAEVADALAARIVALVRDRRRAEELGEAAREFVVRAHSWSSVAEAYERLYRDVGAENRATVGAPTDE
jgi:polysaccharide biosynthesis protein PslH